MGLVIFILTFFILQRLTRKEAISTTAIDRVGKVAYVMLDKSKNRETGAKFLKEVIRFYPYKINYILTDNGFEFSYKALSKHKKTKKIHPF